MSVLTIIAIVLTAWSAVAVVVAGVFNLAIQGISDAPPVTPPPGLSPDVLSDAA